jgi:hypothetical protein
MIDRAASGSTRRVRTPSLRHHEALVRREMRRLAHGTWAQGSRGAEQQRPAGQRASSGRDSSTASELTTTAV